MSKVKKLSQILNGISWENELSLTNEITALSRKWHEECLDGCHKDRDCHFIITKKWSYGNEPEYEVEHYGYIGDDIVADGFKDEVSALRFLRRGLYRNIAAEKEVEKLAREVMKDA